MIVFDTLFSFLILYLFIYCIYQLFFFIKARDIASYFEMQEISRSTNFNEKKFCVIICATYKDRNLDKLLGILNNQSYNKENYETHVLYRVLESDNTTLRDFVLGAKIHNLKETEFVSKDRAINSFIENLKENKEKDFDAFIFLGADRIIGEKYLENINKSILGSGVFVGSRVAINEKNEIAKRIKNLILSAYLKYVNRTKEISRSMFDLPFVLDANNVAITSDVIEKMGYIALEDKTSQLEYSLELAINDVKVTYCPYIISAIDVRNYDFSTPPIKDRVNLFIHYFPQLILKNNAFKEFILFLLKPNSFFVVAAYILTIFLSIYMPNHVVSGVVVLLGVFLLFNLIFSIRISQLTIGEVFWLMFYPLCLAWQKLKLFIGTLTMNSIINSKYDEENINSATINAVVNNGKKDFMCKLDLVAEDGMKKVIFREGSRFITSNSCLRMFDALADMIYKLKAKGMTLKTCQNCQNFSISPDGTLDCLNGRCQISNSEILIWNGCQFFHQSITRDVD